MNWPDYPFDSHYLDLDGIRMHYLDEGPRDADAVVMLHGNPTWSFYYRRLVTALRDTHHTIVPDHVGMGLSDKPSDERYDYTLKRRVDDLERLLDSLGISEKITLVLHDWGGMIGMAYATRHPDRIARLVVLNTAAFHLPANARVPWQLRIARSRILGPLLVRGFNAFCRGAARSCVARRPLSPEECSAYLAPYDTWENRRAVLRFIQDIPLGALDRAYATVSEVEEKLPTLAHVPLLICWGMRDFVFNAHFLDQWQAHFPAAAVHRFADAGHYVLEDAHEEIIPLVHSFLASRVDDHQSQPTAARP